MWLYWCLLSTIISGFTSIAMKKCSNNEQKRLAIMGLFSYHCIMLVISLVIHPDFIFNLNFTHLLKMFPGVIMQSVGFLCAFSCVKYGKVTITSSIKKCNTVVIFILGIIVLQEDFTILQIIISTILIFLSILLAMPKKETSTINKKLERKSILYAYGYVLFNGISKILNKVYVTNFENPLYVIFNYAIITIIGILIYCTITKKWNYIDIRNINAKRYFLLQSLTDSTSSIFSRFSMLDGNVSVISVINTSSIVITVLASRFILKEKITWKKYLMITRNLYMCFNLIINKINLYHYKIQIIALIPE